MSKSRKIIIVLLILATAFLFLGYTTVSTIYLPAIMSNGTRCTPTLAPTMCAGWYEYGICSSTPTPYTICIPSPCEQK